MKDKEKAKLALAEAIVQSLWVKGFISGKERDEICKRSKEKLAKSA